MDALSKNKIKWIKSLRLKKYRDLENLFIVEGEKMVNELIEQWPHSIELIVSTSDHFSYDFPVFSTDALTMKSISTLSTPSSLLAIAKKPSFSNTKSRFTLVLDGIQDPGNMGTILRTADWFNVDQIVCSKETVDIFNPKVIQSSMGSIFRIPVEYADLTKFLSLQNVPIYGAQLEGENVYSSKLSSECILIMGNEGNGITMPVRKYLTQSLHIPRFGNAESLNVAVATGILLSEIQRNQ